MFLTQPSLSHYDCFPFRDPGLCMNTGVYNRQLDNREEASAEFDKIEWTKD